jgi:hypothetical protein
MKLALHYRAIRANSMPLAWEELLVAPKNFLGVPKSPQNAVQFKEFMRNIIMYVEAHGQSTNRQ